jgi:hypothetical protein
LQLDLDRVIPKRGEKTKRGAKANISLAEINQWCKQRPRKRIIKRKKKNRKRPSQRKPEASNLDHATPKGCS